MKRLLCSCNEIINEADLVGGCCPKCGVSRFCAKPLNDELTPEQLRIRVAELEDFVKEIRDGYDCDTGAGGCHAYRCRCCVAGDLLGEPPSTFDPRTRGG